MQYTSYSSLKSIPKIVILLTQLLFAQPDENYSKETEEELNNFRSKIEIAISENDTLTRTRAHYKLGNKFGYIGEKDSSNFHLNLALEFAKKLNNTKAISIISNSIASNYSDEGLHEKAIEIYSDIAEMFLQIPDSIAYTKVIYNISTEYLDIGNYSKSLNLALKALTIRATLKDSSDIAAYFLHIGSIYNATNNNKKWKEYVLKAKSLSNKPNFATFYTKVSILNELGAIYKFENKLDSARLYYDSLYYNSKKEDYARGISTSLDNLVPILTEQKRFTLANANAEEAYEIRKKAGFKSGIITSLFTLGDIQVELKNYERAEKYLLKGLKISREYNFPEEESRILFKLSTLYSIQNKFNQAYNFSEEYRVLNDSLLNIEKHQQISELETKYQLSEKEQNIKLLNNENTLKQAKIENQQKMIFVFVLLAALIIAIIIFFFRQRQLKSKFKILELDQKLLRIQMNPHFLFNALIAIQGYVIKNKKLEATDYIGKFAGLTRSILESSRKEFIPLKQELEILKYYVEIQQLRFKNSFTFNIEVDENIDVDLFQIPPMLVQPFIENAIEHGFKEENNIEKFLSTKYSLVNDSIELVVEDNGHGINQQNHLEKKNKKSYAIEITKERLQNISEIYKSNIDIIVTDLSECGKETGTRITMKIPLKLLSIKND